jgi:stage VI sporulation protein D
MHREKKGGVTLSQENQSYLLFSLEESVWFQKGQEVEELLSISLDPIITVLESDQYVTIRGSLELSGEYKRTEDTNPAQEDDYSVSKFIHSIEEREEGICEFIHRFPVDITIPNNRIQSLEDLDVTVNSFDYLLPDQSCLNLTAELTISGLYGEQQNAPDENIYNYEEAVNNYQQEAELLHRTNQEEKEWAEENGEFNPFEVEAKRPPLNELGIEDEGTVWENPLQVPYTAKGPDISFAAKRSEQTVPIPVPPVADFEEDEQAPSQAPDFDVDIIASDDTHKTEPEVVEESPEQVVEVVKKKTSNKKSMSIAEFLGRKTDNDQHAKLKVCIVQQGDTLETLADRYDLSSQQILKVNHLEANQDMYEGQVLYIPVAPVQGFSR